MNKFLSWCIKWPPYVYALFYISLIPAFGLVYWLLGENSFQGNGNWGFDMALYYSTETITTLGYGDITPSTTLARWLVIAEAIIGVTAIGLFLNSIAHSQAVADSEREKREQRLKERELARQQLARYNSVIQLSIERARVYMWIATTPIAKREKNQEFNPNYQFSEMHDILGPTLQIQDDQSRSAAEYLIQTLRNLKQDVSQLLLGMNLEHFPTLDKVCLAYLDKYDLYADTGALSFYGKYPDLKKTIAEIVSKYTGPVQYYSYANVANPVISLHLLIQETIRFIDNYNRLVDPYLKAA